MKEGDTCPQCEREKLQIIKKDLVFTHQHKEITFKDETVFFCILCKYEGLTEDATYRIDRILTKLRKP